MAVSVQASLKLKIFDREALRRAASIRAKKEGLTVSEWGALRRAQPSGIAADVRAVLCDLTSIGFRAGFQIEVAEIDEIAS